MKSFLIIEDETRTAQSLQKGLLEHRYEAEWAMDGETGLAMLQPTPAFVEAMPSKIYEYLASGLPVLSTRLPRQSKVIEESGGGVLVDSVAEASETLRRWSADPGELEKLRDHALQWAADHLPTNTPYDDLADAILNLLRGTA